jgi:hypothetical protein
MKYLLLLYDDVAATAAMTPDELRAIVDEHVAYARMLRERGVHVLSEPLSGPEEARTIHFDGPGPVVTDGPYLETKEALGGIYVIDCASLDEAVALASEAPRSPGLVAEVRPIPAI